MEFKEFKELQQQHFLSMVNDETHLFTVDIDRDELWNLYLDSFPEGTNELFRERREYDCSCCRTFIKQFGNVVVIKDNCIQTVWDFETNDDTFSTVINALSDYVNGRAIDNVFVTKQSGYGTDKNREQLEDGTVKTWNHFRIDLPKRFVDSSGLSESSIAAKYRDIKQVLKRSFDEISNEAVGTVLDLIAEKTLYKGDEWQSVLSQFLDLHNHYHTLPDNEKDNYCWYQSTKVGAVIGKIRNHSIGVLLQDLSNGVNIETAVKRYENIVAPHNYKRPKAIFTKRMVESAEQTVRELGFMNSLSRKHAVLSDITINNVLWANKDIKPYMNGSLDVFEALKEDIPINVNNFKNAKGISIDEFIDDVMPSATNIEVLFENGHLPNLVSLIAPVNKDSKTMFKWDNNFSWAYKGNIADSSIKERVKMAGGKIDGVLRFSLQWNDRGHNGNDYDAHCIEPSGNRIYFQNKGHRHRSTGMLDVDIINPIRDEAAVENIAWERLPNGVYKFLVHNYSHRGGKDGFTAEIEYNGQTYTYEYHKDIANNEFITVAEIMFKDGEMKILQSLESTVSSKEIWGLKTNQFHSVSSVMYSPNYWNTESGHKHTFFMLAGCKNEDRPNGFFNEYLKQDLMVHGGVFEALGSKMKVEKSDNQLSGIGFSSTKRNSLVCRVDDKVMRIIF